jgi:N-acetyl-gamma-glutamyl-phosphate reductase
MGIEVAVAGASGYAGGELLRLLTCHPGMTLGPLTASSHAGETVAALHPNLPQLAGRRFEPTQTERLARADLVFLALPHGQSAAVAAQLPASVKVVDLGADFRLADPSAWQRFYGGDHAGRWATGLPELPGAREQIAGASRVAVPGCFATAAILALAPLVAAGLVEPSDIVIVAASGTSGAGRAPQPNLLGAEVMGAVSAYQAGGVHRHTPEIEQALAEAQPKAAPVGSAAVPGRLGAALPAPAHAGKGVSVCFTPTLAPMPRGILATCAARLAPGVGGAVGDGSAGAGGGGGGGGADVNGAYAAADATERLRAGLAGVYASEPFVHLLPVGAWPTTAATAGSNAVHLQAAADTRTGRAVVVAALDNLGKGAAGQAIQNANLMTGFAETAGLTAQGVSP